MAQSKKDRIKAYEMIMPDEFAEDRFIKKLDNLGFFDAPASTKRHGAYPGGLFDHSFTVAKYLTELTAKLGLEWKHDRSPAVVGMLHDLCKCGFYEQIPGRYTPEHLPEYQLKDPLLIPGHGDRSVIMLQQLTPITEEELACIRWHMGAYETDTKLWHSYNLAIRLYPNVLWTHTADMYVSKVIGV